MFLSINLLLELSLFQTFHQQPFIFNTQVPTITDLRNPALKQRHWDSIETVLGRALSSEETPITLGLLNELDAFEHSEEIQEVSSQASSESSLEGILKKVSSLF